MPSKVYNPEDIIGEKYSKLTVESFSHRDAARALWMNFRCDCGGPQKCRYYYVRQGRISSCKLCRPHHKRLGFGEAAINQLMTDYRGRAKKKEQEFSLTREDFKNLLSRDCEYCDSEPIYKVRDKHNFGGLKMNGIDRVDPNKGYTVENSVPCCKICNTMKMALGKDEFLNQIERIYLKSIVKDGK